jgi:hypothetical protein
LHDFDKSGFSIAGTFQRNTRRYTFRNEIEVIDLGLRFEDIEGLQSEPAFDKGSIEKRRWNLRHNGATEEEIEFLLAQRVELNAMPSDQLVAFVERKLKEHGVEKVVPDTEELAKAYRLFERGHRIQQIVEEELKKFDGAAAEAPDDIEDSVRTILANDPAIRWIDAVGMVATKKSSGGPS